MNVVFADAWLLVVDKPTGLPTQAGRTGGDNLYDQVLAEHPGASLHHRLDTPASGLVLFVLDPSVNGAVTQMFRDHTIQRHYRAVLYGELEGPAHWVWPVDGKSASTRVTVLGQAAGLVATEITLDTGRTHQIRRHAAHAGVPICGDRRYGADAARRWPRLALHAARLRLPHPATGAPLNVESPLPADLKDLWQRAVD